MPTPTPKRQQSHPGDGIPDQAPRSPQVEREPKCSECSDTLREVVPTRMWTRGSQQGPLQPIPKPKQKPYSLRDSVSIALMPGDTNRSKDKRRDFKIGPVRANSRPWPPRAVVPQKLTDCLFWGVPSGASHRNAGQ